MGYVPYVDFATHRRATVKICLYVKRLNFMKCFVLKKKKKGLSHRGQVPNEEAPHHDRNVQDVMIEDLQRQVAELTQCLAEQNIDTKCDIDDRNSKSNFENTYYNPVLVREQRGQDEEFVDEEFQEDEFVDDEFKHGDVHDDIEHEDVEDP
jgi:hypothetical protein